MGSLAEAAGKFAEKMADVLDVFDLSFFVAGSASLGALLVWLSQNGVELPEGLSAERALVAVIAAYILGLVTYALGRWVRRQALEPLLGDNSGCMSELYDVHHLGRIPGLSQYVTKSSGEQTTVSGGLYSRLWVLVRTEVGLRETYSLVRRYWILSATYDGIGFAALLWLLPVWYFDTGIILRVVLSVLLVSAALVAWRQASMYHRYQIEELAATAAYWHTEGDTPPPVDDPGIGVDQEG